MCLMAGMCLMTSCGKSETDYASQAGTIVRDTILGVPCCVYLPCAYVERAQEVFPVLYLQHGMYGSEDDWSTQGQLLHWMDSLLQCGAIREMVVVMPDNFLGSMAPAERQVLMEAEGSVHWQKMSAEQERAYEMSGYWESHFAQFMEETEQRYHVSKAPSQRAIAGLSMGGFHTIHVSHHLHGQFDYIGLFSPATIPAEPNAIYDPWEEEVRIAATEAKVYWIGIGREDFLYEYVKNYRLWLEANHLEYTYYESAGGHTWDNWQDYICRFMKLIFR